MIKRKSPLSAAALVDTIAATPELEPLCTNFIAAPVRVDEVSVFETAGYWFSPGNNSGADPTVGSKNDIISPSVGCLKILKETVEALVQDILKGTFPLFLPLERVKVSLTKLPIVKAAVGV